MACVKKLGSVFDELDDLKGRLNRWVGTSRNLGAG